MSPNNDPGGLGFPVETLAIFVLSVALSLWLDLRTHKSARSIALKDAFVWSLFWIGLAGAFCVYLWLRFSLHHASLFLSGYLLEKTLSVDNLMVFIAIFSYFRIESGLQHRILYYGILGAVVFRLAFVAVGGSLMVTDVRWPLEAVVSALCALAAVVAAGAGRRRRAIAWAAGAALILGIGFAIERVLVIDSRVPVRAMAFVGFALLILYAAWQMIRKVESEDSEDYSSNGVVQLARRRFPVFHLLDGNRFFISGARARELSAKSPPREPLNRSLEHATWWMTPAFVCLMVVETSDIMFAFDSMPAVIAVTREPLLVYAAMIFAILGLRSLYFVLSALTARLVYLEKAVVVLLVFIAGKLLADVGTDYAVLPAHWHIGPTPSLLIIVGVLAAGVLASFVAPQREPEAAVVVPDQAGADTPGELD